MVRASTSRKEATRGADGRWSAPRRLASAGTVLRPEVGMDARGDAIVAWWAESHESARVRPARGRWLAASRVARSEGQAASLAVDARGDALLAWKGRGGISEASKRPTETTWRTSAVASGPGTAVARPIATLDASGDAVVAWEENEGLDTAWRLSIFG